VADRDPQLDDVVELELKFFRPEFRAAPAEAEPLLHPDFREFAANGQVYERAAVLADMAANPGEGIEYSELGARLVADGVALITYRSAARGRVALRSSLWVKDEAGWRCLYHQGTPVE
jgi:ribonuclease HI